MEMTFHSVETLLLLMMNKIKWNWLQLIPLNLNSFSTKKFSSNKEWKDPERSDTMLILATSTFLEKTLTFLEMWKVTLVWIDSGVDWDSTISLILSNWAKDLNTTTLATFNYLEELSSKKGNLTLGLLDILNVET